MPSKWSVQASTSLSLSAQTDGVRSTYPSYYPQIVTVDNKLLLVNAAVRANTGSTTSDGWEDLVFTIFDKASLLKVGSSNFVSQPYHQAPQSLIKTAPNQAFLLYYSQPSGYHGDGFGLFVDSSGARSSAFSAMDQWIGADWAYGLGRFDDGTYVVNWSSERNGAYDVFAQNLNSSGSRIGNPYLVLGGSGAQFTADESVAVIPNSNQYLTAITNFDGSQYSQSPRNIQLLIVDKATSSRLDQQTLSSTQGDLAKTLIYTSTGAGAVIFESGTSIYARAFSVNSSKLSLGNSLLLWNKSSTTYNVDVSAVETNGGLVAVGIASSNGIDRKLTHLEFDPKTLTISSDPITIASSSNAIYTDQKLANVDLFFDSGVLFAAWTDIQNGEIDVFKLGQTPTVQFSTTSSSANEGNSGTSTITVQTALSRLLKNQGKDVDMLDAMRIVV
jgi:hypothetical protein